MGRKNIQYPLAPKRQYKFDQAQAKPSNYQPSKAEMSAMSYITRDWAVGENIKDRAYEEFNDVSMDERQNIDQRAWNSYVKPRSTDPDEAWKANTVRPVTRNKCISIAAHVTNTLIYPQIFAQNKDDETDQASAEVMRDLMEWTFEQSDYERIFLRAVIGALFNPATIVYDGYHEVKRKFKKMKSDGSYDEKTMEDEEYSGYYNEVVPCDELYIGDIYEHDLQKQPFIIWKKNIDYTQAAQKYAENENFKKYVRPGLRVMYVDEEDQFYEQYDDELEFRLVEEVHYWNRFEDLHLIVCNGVLLTKPDQPNERLDKKYPFAKSGYEFIDEGRFFYYKSLADKLEDDQRIVDVLYNMVIDGSFINLFPPAVVMGTEEIDTSVYTPGTITTFQADTKFDTLPTNNNLAAGINALQIVENSINESSTDPALSGMRGGGGVTAFEVARLEQNARTMLGLFGKMIGFLVKDLGELRLNSILQYMTVGELDELTDKPTQLRYKTILLEDKAAQQTKKIEFDPGLPTEPMPEREALFNEAKLLEKQSKMDNTKLYKVHPKLFRELKYKLRVIPDLLLKPTGAMEKALKLEAYDRMIQNPFLDQTAITKEFLLEVYKPGESDKYMKKQQAMPEMPVPEGAEQQATEKISKDIIKPTREGARELTKETEEVKEEVAV